MINWKTANDAAKWIPALNAAETKYGIPPNLLARQAFQESSFLPEVISGHEESSAGCRGILQLNPKYFPYAGRNTYDDIDTGAQFMLSLYARFKDWQLALAAYNWGPGAVHHWIECGGHLPIETSKYVTQICADVPVPGSIIGGANVRIN